jgi:DNA polymerase
MEELARIRREVEGCRRCNLYRERNNVVFGTGDKGAKLVIIGEAPGRLEDIEGKPFVGEAGQLLNRMLQAISISREEVYITNVVKCRPPKNRTPSKSEISACYSYLVRQLEIIQPSLILTLGNFATQTILSTKKGITNLRGKLFSYKGIPLIPTFHPAALLRNPKLKKLTLEDMQKVSKLYERLWNESLPQNSSLSSSK